MNGQFCLLKDANTLYLILGTKNCPLRFSVYPRRKKGISTKLLTRWEGPYVILNILNDCNARIKNLENNKVVIVHIDRLAKCPEGDENKHTDLTSAWLSYAT
ncbi:Ribosome-recycling factor [Frankliniella fusca]|uniref:Ribosome-recycling factor n=1 Tax=Frankliniella fusca TaxID=407009 RepID=A0AAE1HS24_9NEOP|nr:Ribosome-recycling factor [Frankliniella fusca]